MDLLRTATTAIATLSAVLLGGWLTTRTHDRTWTRENDRQWRNARITSYTAFIEAFRQYVAFTLERTAQITAIPHPRRTGEMMPVFDEIGRPYRERLEARRTEVLLVTESQETLRSLRHLMQRVRHVASKRGAHDVGEMSTEAFQELWKAESDGSSQLFGQNSVFRP